MSKQEELKILNKAKKLSKFSLIFGIFFIIFGIVSGFIWFNLEHDEMIKERAKYIKTIATMENINPVTDLEKKLKREVLDSDKLILLGADAIIELSTKIGIALIVFPFGIGLMGISFYSDNKKILALLSKYVDNKNL